ncbi:MAG TPA: alginate export family protein, partial [Bdellovibrionales bacterium]|nr:alginate export family protein [Bdellovibrionales bacterium]
MITRALFYGFSALIFSAGLAAHAAAPSIDPGTNPVPTPSPESTSAPAPERPRYLLLRYDENWLSLRDSAARTKPLDRLKYVPFTEEPLPYLTLGGEARIRYERFTHPNFGAEAEDPDGYLLQRYYLHADFQLHERVRLFYQLQASNVEGRKLGPRATDRDELDTQQAFLDYKFWSSGKNHSTLRFGRQEIELGSARLISVREGLNIRVTHDGVRYISQDDRWYFTGFFVRPVATNPYVFDNYLAPTGYLWALAGLTNSGSGLFPGYVLFYHGLHRADARYDIGVAHETRHLLGARGWGALQAPWEFEVSLIGQFGSFGDRSIQAWGMTTDTGYVVPESAMKLRFGVKANVASGDTDRSDNVLGTYNPLYTATAYSGLVGLLGPSNLMDVTPNVSLRPSSTLMLAAWSAFYWRYSTHDGIYGIFTNLQRTAQQSAAA